MAPNTWHLPWEQYVETLKPHERPMMPGSPFVDAAAELGFRIELNTATARPQRLQQLADTPVHPQFAGIPPEQLCITSIDFIARKPHADSDRPA